MRKKFDRWLIRMACGWSFILGTFIITIEGILAFLAGCILYFTGFWLMDKYREMG